MPHWHCHTVVTVALVSFRCSGSNTGTKMALKTPTESPREGRRQFCSGDFSMWTDKWTPFSFQFEGGPNCGDSNRRKVNFCKMKFWPQKFHLKNLTQVEWPQVVDCSSSGHMVWLEQWTLKTQCLETQQLVGHQSWSQNWHLWFSSVVSDGNLIACFQLIFHSKTRCSEENQSFQTCLPVMLDMFKRTLAFQQGQKA